MKLWVRFKKKYKFSHNHFPPKMSQFISTEVEFYYDKAFSILYEGSNESKGDFLDTGVAMKLKPVLQSKC